MYAEAERLDKYGFKLTGRTSRLQMPSPCRKTREYGKRPATFIKPSETSKRRFARKGLIFRRLPKGTKEMLTEA